MIAVSSRHVPLLLALVVLLLVPIARARFEIRRLDDCARPEALLELGRVPGGSRPEERYEKYDEDLRQWTVVELSGNDRSLKLHGALIRSFRPRELYTRPPRFLLGPFEAGQRRVDEVAVDGEVLPIQSVRDATHGRSTLASWLFVYQGRPVRHPLLAQLATAPAQVWSGTRPLSLLLVAGDVAPGREAEARSRSERWLVAAFEHHRAACAPAP